MFFATFPIISGSIAEIASSKEDVFTEKALNRNTPAAGNNIPQCRTNGIDFSFATGRKFTAHMACWSASDGRQYPTKERKLYGRVLGREIVKGVHRLDLGCVAFCVLVVDYRNRDLARIPDNRRPST